MGWNFDLWLRQHRKDIEERWLEAVQELPTCASLPVDESRSRWHTLFETLLTDQIKDLAEGVWQWADREVVEHKTTPSELLSITAGLS
ncbi:MAG: hypothetical protein V3S14_11435, partial [Anaerolineae bacterium]